MIEKNQMLKFTREIIFILLTIVFAVVCVACGGSDDDTDYGILRVVPGGAGVVVKTSDLCGLCAALDNDNMIWAQVRNIPSLKSAAGVVYTVDTLAQKNHSIRSQISGKDAVVSFYREGDNKVCVVVGVAIPKDDAIALWTNIKSIAEKQRKVVEAGSYDGVKFYKVYDRGKKNSPIFLFTYCGGVVVVSTSSRMIDYTIRQIKTGGNGITQDAELVPLLKGIGRNVAAVVLFNHNQLGEMIGGELSNSACAALERHAGWSALDIDIKKQVATCAGYTAIGTSSHRLGVIKSQTPVKNSCPEYLPSKTISFVSLGISDMHLFENDFANHLKSTSAYGSHLAFDDKVHKDYKVRLSELLYSNIVNRVTEFTCTFNVAGRGDDRYVVAELLNADDFEAKVSAYCKKYRDKNGITDKDGLFKFTTSSQNSYRVYKFPESRVFREYFGDIFSADASYFMIYKDNAVFGHSVSSLYEYANNNDNGKVLANNSIYDGFSGYVNEESNLYYYIDLSFAQDEMSRWLSKGNAAALPGNMAYIQHLRSFAVQYSHTEGDFLYTNAALLHSTTVEADRYVSWLAQTEALLCGKPQVLNRHYSGEKDIFVQDETNKLYRFERTGERRFVKQLAEPLTSPLFQVDMFGDQKKQYVFATENFLYAIDVNGNFVGNYPVQLPARVSAEISVFDYDRTRDYRIFVPCSDGYLYVYTKDGKPLDTWTPLRTNDPVLTPVQFFRIDDSDYLVFSDNLKTYILNHRGEVRINVSNVFPKSKNSLYYLENPGTPDMRLVTTTSSGEVKYIYSDGSCKSKTFRDFTANHYFVLHDIDGDGVTEYIFTDGDMLYVYNADGREKFSFCADGSLGRPNIFSFSSKDVRIGVACRSLGKIFLIDNKGNCCSGFPLNGSTDFSISQLNGKSKFSVLVGGTDNYLYNYWIY